MSNSWIDSGDGTGIYCDADADSNLLHIKLKKPKAWKWELTTSRSSPNIALPRIMLYNHKGDLLVDANQQVDDAVYKEERKPPMPPKRRTKKLLRTITAEIERALQDDEDTGLGSLDSTEKISNKPLRRRDLSFHKEIPLGYRNIPNVEDVSRTFVLGERKTNGYRPWRNSVPDEIDFGSLQICEATDSERSPQKSPAGSEKFSPLPEDDVNMNIPWRRKLSLKEKIIEPPVIKKRQLESNRPLVTKPIEFDDCDQLFVSKASWKPFHSSGHLNRGVQPMASPFERRASSFKEVRFNVHPASDEDEHKPKEKRRYRRSSSNGRPPLTSSGSILERLSAMKCRLSSPEFETAETHQVQMGPRYFLRTSRAGTLVVAEESFKQRRVRRRPLTPKMSSNENFLSPTGSTVQKSSSYKQAGLLGANLGVPCAQSQSMNSFADTNGSRQRRKMIPIRRHRSDGNILLYSSSDEEDHKRQRQNSGSVRHRKTGSWRQNQGEANGQIELIR